MNATNLKSISDGSSISTIRLPITIILPVGSIPGTWGIAEMKVFDKAYNVLRANFTEIIRFVVQDTPEHQIYQRYQNNSTSPSHFVWQ